MSTNMDRESPLSTGSVVTVNDRSCSYTGQPPA